MAEVYTIGMILAVAIQQHNVGAACRCAAPLSCTHRHADFCTRVLVYSYEVYVFFDSVSSCIIHLGILAPLAYQKKSRRGLSGDKEYRIVV